MTVAAALTQLKTNIDANLAATGQSSLANTWIYPDDYASINLKSLPVAIVMRRVAIPQQWGWWTFGVGSHRWEAEVFLLLSKGVLTGFDTASATTEKLHAGWPKGMADTLAADITLSGNCEYVGNGEQGVNGILFDYVIEHIEWAQEVYWGIHFNIPVTQRVTHTTG